MTEAKHQVLGSRASGSGKSLAGVPQIVKPEAGHSGLEACTGECLAHSIASHRSAIAADEHPIGTGPGRHVCFEHGKYMRRNVDGALPGIGLGRRIEGLRLRQQLDPVTPDRHRPGREVNVIGKQAEHFPAAQAAPCGQQDSRAIPRAPVR